MLICFSCDAYANIVMFGDIAKQLLTLMGHSGEVPGAILAKDVPNALAALRKSLHKKNPSSATQASQEHDVPVSLLHRALPLMDLLDAAEKKSCDVLWREGF